MTQAHKTNGAIVELKDKVYHAPYTPFYDHHKGKTWEVIDGNHAPGHVLCRNTKDHSERYAFHDDELVTTKR